MENDRSAADDPTALDEAAHSDEPANPEAWVSPGEPASPEASVSPEALVGLGESPGAPAGWGSRGRQWLAKLSRYRSEALCGVAVVAVAGALGGPLGLLWRLVAPKVELIRGDDGWYPIKEGPEEFFADDGWFALLGAGLGVLLAVAAWLLLRRFRGPVVLVGLVVGSLLCALFAEWLGHRIGLDGYLRRVHDAAPGTRLLRQVKLRDDVVLLIQPALVAATYTLLAAFHPEPSLYLRPPAPASASSYAAIPWRVDESLPPGSPERESVPPGSQEHADLPPGSQEHADLPSASQEHADLPSDDG